MLVYLEIIALVGFIGIVSSFVTGTIDTLRPPPRTNRPSKLPLSEARFKIYIFLVMTALVTWGLFSGFLIEH